MQSQRNSVQLGADFIEIPIRNKGFFLSFFHLLGSINDFI